MPGRGLEDLFHLAAAQAAGADLEALLRLSDHRADFVDVGLPHPACPVFRVAHLVARDGRFSAYITLACHGMPALKTGFSEPQRYLKSGGV